MSNEHLAKFDLDYYFAARTSFILNHGSPDGTKIAFTGYGVDSEEIYVISADGSNRTRLTFNFVDDFSPSWSPDGEKLTVLSEREETFEIYVMNADGSSPVRLTFEADGGTNAAIWQPL
jgi:TolB protein